MSLLYIDGFDLQDDTGWVRMQSSGPNYDTSNTRYGYGACMSLTNNMWQAKTFTPSSKVVVGLAVDHSTVTTTNQNFLELYGDSNATQHLCLRRTNGANTLQLYRGGTVIATSTGDVFVGTWQYIEISATIADSGGRVIVRVNGDVVIDFTGDTKNGGTAASIDTVRLRCGFNSGTPTIRVDDLYVLDGVDSGLAGMPNNDFLGDRRVVTLRPNGAGSSTQFAPSAGANWQCVDEAPPSATDYVASATTGQRDTYALEDLPAGVTVINALQNTVYALKSDAGSASLKPALKSGATVAYDPTVGLSASMTRYSTVRQADPATSAAWSAAAVNALEAGAEVA